MNDLSLFNPDEATSTNLAVMTVDEVASVLGYDSEYLRKKCTELGFTRNGVKTVLNEKQVTKLKSVLVPRSSDMKVRGQNAVTHLEMLQNIQRYIDAGYFRILENSYCTPDGITHIKIKTVVYQKGLDFIRKILPSFVW